MKSSSGCSKPCRSRNPVCKREVTMNPAQPTLPQPTRFLDPVALTRISSLELVARTVVEGFISGLHRSPHLGFSVNFAEYRPYRPGDDIRRLDWKVYGRSDRFYIKEYEGET